MKQQALKNVSQDKIKKMNCSEIYEQSDLNKDAPGYYKGENGHCPQNGTVGVISYDSVNEYINNPKWYIITAISGNEESVIKNLKGKIASYGYTDKVRDIKLIKEKIVKIEEYSADNAPANVGKKLKNVQ